MKANRKYQYRIRAYRTYQSKGKTKYKYGKYSKKLTVKTARVLKVINLKAGYYTAGKDIPAGTFDVKATAGVGFISSDSCGANLRGPEYKKDDFDSFSEYSRSFSNYKLNKGEILTVSDVQVKFEYSKITNNASGRTYDRQAAVKLGPGFYKVGRDIESGRYCVQYVSGGGGYVSSDRSEGDCILNNNMDGDPKTGEYTDYVSNVVLKNGETIEVTSGLTVLFIPEE